ncbi:Signal transduction histidine kinase [Frankia canadensis]|uniref:histidine kinase n=1 Tax=Frankia canadensis TaxID=1836972 RepID=A0A2I2KNP9_9ACTN|nr:ATP-binding protein [Frankia canadensis]SNQ47276.1 Signal transduction histidine kinase [Frankia canadensis]SOU54566.1 Signal transduction histidine kinase [Frankia canadensis]
MSAEALSAICSDVALRDLNLVDSLLSLLEELEAREQDAERLAELYQLDHLAARLRRNAENLRVLAGRDASDTAAETTPLVDVIRAAMSSIDHYSRVTIGRVVPLGVVGFAAEDVSRLLAELLDNATKSSPPTTPVRVGVHLTEQGSALLRVEDEGIGLPPERLHLFNDRLRAAPILDDDAVRHMGLAVVGRIADRHDMRTWLTRRHPHGTTASVLLPAALLCELPETSWSGTRTVTAPVVAAVDPQGPPAAPTIAGLPSRRASRPSARSRVAGAGGPARLASAAPTLRPVPSPADAPPPSDGTTSSGLPRRVSRSLKDATGPRVLLPPTSRAPADRAPADRAPTDQRPTDPPAAEPPPPTDQPSTDRTADHERLLADFDAFSQGEQAAHDEQRGA